MTPTDDAFQTCDLYGNCVLHPLGVVVGVAFLILVPAAILRFLWWAGEWDEARRRQPWFHATIEYKAEYRRMRALVIRQRGNRCARCGSADRVEMHHVVPRARGGSNNPSNLVPLCHRHHKRVHRIGF